MTENRIKTRIVQKHDIAVNWENATEFIPKLGEIIIYDIDANYSYERIKVGDGVKNVNALPFVTDALEMATNEYITTLSQAVLNIDYDAILAFDTSEIVIDKKTSPILGQGVLGHIILA